jgi:peptidyl-prolyl cis-trans isomerase C
MVIKIGKNKYGKGYQKKDSSSTGIKAGGAPIRGGKIKASHILVEKYNKAQELYEDIKMGQNFEKLAKQFSTCSSKNRGGNLGEFSKGDMVPEFWNACSKLNIGEISQPVKTKFGYHIIRRTG